MYVRYRFNVVLNISLNLIEKNEELSISILSKDHRSDQESIDVI